MKVWYDDCRVPQDWQYITEVIAAATGPHFCTEDDPCLGAMADRDGVTTTTTDGSVERK